MWILCEFFRCSKKVIQTKLEINVSLVILFDDNYIELLLSHLSHYTDKHILAVKSKVKMS